MILCSTGNLIGAQEMFHLNFNIDILTNGYIFYLACVNGHLAVAQWLLEVNPNINILAQNQKAFRYACQNGHLQVAQWLIHINPAFNVFAKNSYGENVFYAVCISGQLDVAKWLFQITPKIDISAHNEKVFREVCNNNQLHIAKWLLEVKPDINISAENHEAFRNICKFLCYQTHVYATYGNNDIQIATSIAQWLQSLKPHLYVIIYDNMGKYRDHIIRHKEDKNWEKRKQLVFMASSGEDNLLYRLPIDISRMVIEYI